MLDICGISVETECNENIVEGTLYILDEYRGIESEGSYADIITLMYEISELLALNRVELVLVKTDGVDEVIELDIALIALCNISSELIECEIGDDSSGSSARKSVVSQLSVEAGNAVLGVTLLNDVEQLVIEISANVKRYSIFIQ